jgi:hypothetical protein
MRKRIQVDLQIAQANNYITVQDALTDLTHQLDANKEKETVDVCEDLLLYYKSQIEKGKCATTSLTYSLKHNVIVRYLKE